MGKKSFIIHYDSLSVLQHLTVQEKAELLDAIANFNIFGDEGELSTTVKIAFEPFKKQFMRDNDKYIEICEIRSKAGRLGGRPKNQKKQKVFTESKKSKRKQTKAKKADNDNDNDNESDNENENENLIALDRAIIDFQDHRKKMKKPLTKHAKALLIKKLEKLAPGDDETKIEIIERSIMNGWLGVFQLNDGKYKTRRDEDEIAARNTRKFFANYNKRSANDNNGDNQPGGTGIEFITGRPNKAKRS